LISRYWLVNATSGGTVVVTRDGAGGWFHLTLHGGIAAHVKVLFRGREHTRPLTALPELAPGFRRLVQIQVPPPAARFEAAPDAPMISVIPCSVDPDQWVVFEVILEHPRATLTGWPGMNTGTGLVGRVNLRDGSRVCVIHREAKSASGSFTGPNPPEHEKRRMRRLARTGSLAALMFGEDDDGTLWVLDAHTKGSWFWRAVYRIAQVFERSPPADAGSR